MRLSAIKKDYIPIVLDIRRNKIIPPSFENAVLRHWDLGAGKYRITFGREKENGLEFIGTKEFQVKD
jgi:hypothetical protein